MIYYNDANYDGGGMYLENKSTGTLTAANCTVYDNEATDSGGGMFLENKSTGTLTTVNCTVYSNDADDGGGMYFDNFNDGMLTFANSISFGNTAATEGPDVYHYTTGIEATLMNCLLGEAAAGDPLTITNPVSIDDGNGNVLGYPLFASRNPNESVFLRLTDTSPALDAGDNSSIPTSVTTDLAGNNRIQNTTVDLGAYEGAFVLLPSQQYYVDENASSGVNDGTSWANAYTDLQDALGQAGPGDSIFVADGIYLPTTGTNRTISFTIPRGVLVYGGFASGEANLAARDLSLGNETILSGDIGIGITTLGDFDDAGYDDNSYHVVSMINADALLDGFIVQGGNANGSESDEEGGGIYAIEAETLRNMTVRYNISSGDGGGMFISNSSIGTLTAVNCMVYDNKSEDGGGMYLENESTGTITAVNCMVYDNEAKDDGGGMYLWSESIGTVTAVNCMVYGNEAKHDGGGMFLENESTGTLTAVNCTVYDNKAEGDGGGMLLYNESTGTLTAVNCTVYDNKAEEGGGMYLQNESTGTITAVNCTIYGNEAEEDGGGMYFDNVGDGILTFANSISFGNTAAIEGPDAYYYTTRDCHPGFPCPEATLAHCLLGEAAAGDPLTITNNVLADPLFASTTPGEATFLRLSATSPALDAGDNSLVPTGVTTDLAGNVRIQDGKGDNTATVDLGAYERPSIDLVLVNTSPNVDENVTSGSLSTLNVTNTSLSVVSFTVSEGNAASTYFGVTITATDTTLVVLSGATLDAETATSHDITIQGKGTDGNEVGNALDATIMINDVNDEAPTIPILSLPATNAIAIYAGNTATLVAPTLVNAILLNATSTDADATTANNTVTYRLEAVSPTMQTDLDAILAIDENTGVITLTNALGEADNGMHTFKVVASDGVAGTADAETADQTLEINISATAASYTLMITSPSVDENVTSGSLSALNLVNGDAITGFEVSEGNAASSNFEVMTNSGGTWMLQVASGATLDAETALSHTITIQGKDTDGNDVGNALDATITINDVNDEAPTTPALSLPASDPVATYAGNMATITELTAADAVLLNAASTDADVTAANNAVVYSLVSVSPTTPTDLDAILAIDENTGVITLTKALTTADNGTHTFKVIASDGVAGRRMRRPMSKHSKS